VNEIGGGIKCPQCGAVNMSVSAFCHACGLSLRQPGAPVPPTAHGYQSTSPAPFAPPSQSYQPTPPAPYDPRPTPFSPPTQGFTPTGYQSSAPLQAPPAIPYQPPSPQGYQYSPARGYEPPYGQSPAAYTGGGPVSGVYGNEPPPSPYGGYGQSIAVNVNPMINMQAPYPVPPQPPMVVVQNAEAPPSLLVRALWFLFFGVWLGLFATIIGWVLCVLVITLPLGLLILNRLPQIMTLRPPSRSTQVTYANGVTMITTNVGSPQLPFLLRAVYFTFIGWWLTALWLVLAWVFVAATPITLGMSLVPAFMMFNRVPQVLTLREN